MEIDGDCCHDMFPVEGAQEVGERREESGQTGDGVGQGAFEDAVAQRRVEPADVAQQRGLCRGAHGVEAAGQRCDDDVEEALQAAALGRVLARLARSRGSSPRLRRQRNGVIVARL